MKQKLENVMKNKKVMIALMEILIAIGCIVICYLLMSSNNRAKETTYSYSKLEEVTEYKVVDNYITRVMPLTTYDTFKEIAENTLNAASENVQYRVKVYSDAEKTEEVIDGYIASGMVVEALEKVEPLNVEETEEQETVNETSETESVQTVQEQNQELAEETEGMIYTVSVIGDMTSDGDVNVTELTKLIKNIIGLKDWELTDAEKLAADISEDGDINVVDIELCINYIVFGELKLKQPEEPEKPIEPAVEYTVVFKDEDGTIISTNTYEAGDRVEIPENPEKAADETGLYSFVGWTPEVEEIVTKDAEYTATYEKQYFIARVEETGISYFTLNEALQSVVSDARTIKMLKDTKESVTIGEGQNITLNLNGKIIEGTEAYVINNQGDLIIINETEDKEGIIKASGNSSYGLYNDKGNIILKSGNIVSRKYGVYNPNDGIVEIGVKDQAITTDTPTIQGKTNAVYDNLNSSGKINYYDGTLKGKIAIFGGISDTEDNSKIVSTNEKTNEVIALEEIEESNTTVAKIGENEYKTIREAVEAVAENTEDTTIIKLLADFDITKVVEIPQNKNITIDLAGYTVTTYGKGGIINNGTLQIIDSTEEAKGKIISKVGIGYLNKGNLIIENGTVESNGYGIYNEIDGILTLGIKDGEANTTNPNVFERIFGKESMSAPTINGTTFGIINFSTFNFYDGLVLGEKPIEGVISDKEYGHRIVNDSENGKNVCFLQQSIDGNYYDSTDENGITWSYVYQDGTATNVDYISGTLSEVVTIPSELDGYTVVSTCKYVTPGSIFSEADSQKSEIKQIIIPEAITSINAGLYTYLDGITNIEIPEWVKGIGEFAFYGCNNLTTINISKSVENINRDAIYGDLTNLINIEVSEENNNFCDVEGVVYSKDKTTIVKCPTGRESYSIIEGTTIIGDSAFMGCSLVANVTMPNSVTSIGYGAFSGCSAITSIKLSNNLTSINDWAFSGCSGLTELELPDSLTYIGYGGFANCEGLKSINIPQNVTYINFHSFRDCSSLTDIYIDNLQSDINFPTGYDHTTYAYVHYSDCKHTITKEVEEGLEVEEVSNNLEYGNIPCRGNYQFKIVKSNDEIEVVYVISQGEFTNSEDIRERIYPNEDGIYTIESVDRNKTITIETLQNGKNVQATDENGITWNYTYKDGNATNVYYESGELGEKVIIPTTLDGYKVIRLYNGYGRNIFVKNDWEENSTVKEVSIPDELIEIGGYAFFECTSLENIEIPDKVTSIKYEAFRQCTSLENVIIGESVKVLEQAVFAECTSLITIRMSESVTNIESDVFWLCSSLEEIYMPDSVISIESSAFADCSSLININIDSKNQNYSSEDGILFNKEKTEIICYPAGKVADLYTIPDSVTNIGENAFRGCNNLKNVAVGNSVTSIGSYAFYNCDSLVNIEIPDSVTSIGNYAFYECGSLVNIEIPYGVTYIDYGTFERCKNLKEVIIPDSVTSIGEYAFYECDSLVNIEIPDNVTSIEQGAFRWCDDLTRVKISERVTKIERQTFEWCSRLKEVIIPNSVTSIEYAAFWRCSNLISIEIPGEVTNIGEEAFEECYGLEDIYIGNLESNITFGENWNNGVNAYMHFADCKHNIVNEISEEGLYIEEVSNNVEEGKIPCRDNYQFKLVDENGEIVKNKVVILRTQGRKINSADVEYGILPNQEGIYTIENVDRKKTIVNAVDLTNGMNLIATDENGITWNYTYQDEKATNVHCESGVLGEKVVIPGVLDIYPVVSLQNNQGSGRNIFAKKDYESNTTVKEVIIPQGLETIGDRAFRGCANIESIEIPSTVTSIGESAFSNCNSLTSIELPSSIVNVGYRAFEYCEKLTDIYVDNIKSNVTFDYILSTGSSAYIHYNDCKHRILTKIYTKENRQIQEVGNKLDDGKILCGDTYKFKILDENGEIVIDEKVTIKSQGEFIHSSVVKEEIIPNEEGIYTIENIKRNKIIEIGTTYQATVDGITWNYTYEKGNAINVYYESGELSETVDIPSYLDGYPVISLYNSSEERSIFAKAEVEYEELERRVVEERKVINPLYESTLQIKTINIPNTVKEIGDNAFEICTSVETINIPDSVTNIGNYAFFGCTGLTSINIPNNVTTIGDFAFSICSRLTSVEIPSSVTSINNTAFAWSNSLSDIYVNNTKSNLPLENYEETYAYIHYSDCKHKIDINMYSNKNIEIEELSNNLEEGKIACREKYQFRLVNEEGEVVEDEKVIVKSQGQFTDLSETEEEITPNEEGIYIIENINRNKTITIGQEIYQATVDGITWNYTYQDGKAINVHYSSGELSETVEIPDYLDGYEVIEIGDNAFYNCSNLTNVVIPESVINIGNSAFLRCSSLRSVVIPNGVKNIGNSAFMNCSNLEIIEIPDSVVSIGGYAFESTAWYENQQEGVVYAGKVAYIYKGPMSENMSIELEEGTKGIAEYAFRYGGSLKEMIIPDSVIRIGKEAFESCSNLTTITMSKNIEYIGDSAFSGCTNLSSIVIWKSVDEVGRRTFRGWRDMQTINIEAEETPSGWDENWNEDCEAKIVYAYSGD